MRVIEAGAAVLGPRLFGPEIEDTGHASRPAAFARALQAHLCGGRLQHALDEADILLSLHLAPAARIRIAGMRGLSLAMVGRSEDGLEALVEVAAITVGDPEDRGTILSCWAEAALWGGLPRLAIERAAEAIRTNPDPDDLVRAVLAGAWAELELDRSPSPPRTEIRRRLPTAALAELRGIEALARGAWHVAEGWFLDAAGQWAASSAPRALLCRWATAEARRRSGGAAAVQLRAVLEAAISMGFEPLAARVRRSLRLAGDRPASPSVPRSGGRILTGRERQVLELVERGRTNGEIARRMALGRPTVARLLSNAMVKLGADSRCQAIAIHACSGAIAAAPGDPGTPDMHDDARSILRRIAAGRTLGATARELGLSRRTADRRLADARSALGAERTTEAVARASRLGWLA